MRNTTALCCVFLIMSVPLFAAGDSRVLSDFENPAAASLWRVTDGTFSLEAVSGGHAGRIEFNLPSEGAPRAAAVLVLNGSLLPRNDWSAWERIEMDLVNASREKVGVVCDLRDSTVRYAHDLFILKPGERKKASLDVSGFYRRIRPAYGSRDEKENERPPVILSLVLSQDRPGRANPLLVDNVRLVAAELSLHEAMLCPDPLKGGMLAVRCDLNRLALVEARVYGPDGSLVKRRYEETKNFHWLWDCRDELETLTPGRYRAELIVTDCRQDLSTVIRRDLGAFEVAPPEDRPEIAAWQVPTTRKVRLDDNPDSDAAVWELPARGMKTDAALRVEMARGEYEGCQVVFRVRDAVRRLSFSVEDLRNVESNSPFPKEGLEILQVGYVFTRDPVRYEVERMGWWPDALLPVEQMFARPGECMPVWINLKSSRETGAGTYRGRLIVKAEGIVAGEMPLEVTVHDAVLPESTTIRTAFTTAEGLFAEIHGGKLTDSLEMKYHTFVAEHRLNPDNIYRNRPPKIELVEHFAKKNQLNAFNLMYVGGRVNMRDRISTDSYIQELAAILDPYVAELRKRGLADKAYLYGFDEIGPEMFESIRKVMGFLKKRYPEIPTVTTGYDPTYGHDSGLLDEVDVWTPLTPSYDLERAEATRKRGKEVWWYICVSPPHPYANWFVEHPAVEARLIWWMTWQQRVPGFLYYLTNLRHSQESLMQLTGWNKTDWNPASWRTANGDGCFIYSGTEGPISTIRFENIRDGIEDTELLFMLQKKAGREAGEKLCAKLFKSVKDFSTDTGLFSQVRGELLRAAAGKPER